MELPNTCLYTCSQEPCARWMDCRHPGSPAPRLHDSSASPWYATRVPVVGGERTLRFVPKSAPAPAAVEAGAGAGAAVAVAVAVEVAVAVVVVQPPKKTYWTNWINWTNWPYWTYWTRLPAEGTKTNQLNQLNLSIRSIGSFERLRREIWLN